MLDKIISFFAEEATALFYFMMVVSFLFIAAFMSDILNKIVNGFWNMFKKK